MKKFVVLALILASTPLLAQNFEGTITWSIKSEITDPKMKAELEGAQAKMNDPATQAKMKELQARMNDPQMKAMMESNPQMKAQMENMMKMSQDGMNSMMPTGLIIQLKGNNSLIKMEGGMLHMEILNLKDKDLSYRLDRNNKVYSVVPHTTQNNGQTPQVKVTKTNETAKILNYTCTKYIVDAALDGKATQNVFWSTTEIKDIDVSQLANQRIGRKGQSLFYEGIEGVPLKMQIQTAEARMTMEVTSLKKESLPASLFVLPADFKEIKSMGF